MDLEFLKKAAAETRSLSAKEIGRTPDFKPDPLQLEAFKFFESQIQLSLRLAPHRNAPKTPLKPQKSLTQKVLSAQPSTHAATNFSTASNRLSHQNSQNLRVDEAVVKRLMEIRTKLKPSARIIRASPPSPLKPSQ